MNLTQKIAAMGRQRIIALGVAATAILVLGAVALSIATSPQYRPVATELTASSASEIVASLEQAGYDPRISADGTMVSLPEEDVARARMSLAEAGLPASGTAGWELFDNASGIGMNSFLQKVSRLRALEGELARSVQTLDTVESARVHLVLPEREAFSQDRPTPSASVIVRTRRNLPMQRSQALAVRNLIAASVPGLAPERVTVLSTSGETILSEENQNSNEGLANTQGAIESRLTRNIENIISARVGAGNVRVQVAAELETSRQVVIQQSYNPDEQVARSTSSATEKSQGRDGASGGVDAANNMPGVALGDDNGGSGKEESRSKSVEEATYEIGSTRSERVTEAGAIKRLTVAVLINGTMENGEYVERSPEELEQLSALARSTVGLDTSRGDVVTVESLRFVQDMDMFPIEEPTSQIQQLLAENFGTILRGLMAILVVALVLILGVRPMLSRIPGQQSEELAVDEDEAAKAEEAKVAEAKAQAAKPVERITPPLDRQNEELVSIDSVSGGIMKQYIVQLGEMVDQDPEVAVRTLRSWINKRP